MSNNQQLPGTVGFRNQGISAERCAVHASEDVLGVNSLPFFRNKDLYELFECYVHIHSLKELRNRISRIIRLWSLFCSIRVYASLHFLLIHLENIFFIVLRFLSFLPVMCRI